MEAAEMESNYQCYDNWVVVFRGSLRQVSTNDVMILYHRWLCCFHCIECPQCRDIDIGKGPRDPSRLDGDHDSHVCEVSSQNAQRATKNTKYHFTPSKVKPEESPLRLRRWAIQPVQPSIFLRNVSTKQPQRSGDLDPD
jgi:hypothetical protein